MSIIREIALDFCKGEYDHKIKDEVWPLVFEYLNENSSFLPINRKRIHLLWTVNGGNLRRKISNDELVLSILQKFLPGYNGVGMTLFRGECKFLYDANKIDFCWTPYKEVAQKFASGLNSIESGGVLLKAFAPSESILSSPNEHSIIQMREHEYTCNPNSLENIEVIGTFDKFK